MKAVTGNKKNQSSRFQKEQLLEQIPSRRGE